MRCMCFNIFKYKDKFISKLKMAKINRISKGPKVDFHIYAGTVRGAIAYTECKKNKKPTYELKELDGEITALEWGQTNDEILLGNKHGAVKIYNTGLSKFTANLVSTELKDTDAVVGLGIHVKNIIIGRKDGTINVYNLNEKKENDVFKLNLCDDATMNVMIYNMNTNVIATGGENNDLKLWDLSTKKNVFKAKSMGKDELELPIPTSIRGICFLKEDNIVACTTKEGMVLLYDDRAQRRPVKKLRESKASFTTMTPYRERSCFVGTTKGYLQLIDMRQAKCIKTFQPFAGAVTGIVCDDKEPYVVSTSLDKHLRIHNVDTKELIHKEYLKIALTKVLMRPVVKGEPKDETVAHVDDEFEGMFDNMETVNDDEIEDRDGHADGDEEDLLISSSKRNIKKTKSLIKNAKKLKAA